MEYIVRVFGRHLFYLNICESFLTGKLHVNDRQLTAQIASLIGYIETKACNRMSGPPTYKDWLPADTQLHTDSEICSLISSELLKLNGLSKVVAEYRLIQISESLEMCGACFHRARNSAGASVNIAATSNSVVFFSDSWKQSNR